MLFLIELREAKVLKFINLKYETMTLKEYCFNFIELARYATHVVVVSRLKMSKFVSGVSKSVEECWTIMLIKEMDISRIMVHT